MTLAIGRYQIREEILNWNETHANKISTESKTYFVWKKVYLANRQGLVHFVELNFFQRVVRWLFGSYSETIFKDPIKEKIQQLLSYEGHQTVFSLQKMIQEAKNKGDYQKIRIQIDQEIAKASHVAKQDLEELRSHVESFLVETTPKGLSAGYVSDKLLMALMNLVSCIGKTVDKEAIWDVIERVLEEASNPEYARMNIAVFKALVNVVEEDSKRDSKPVELVPCLEIEVPDELTEELTNGIGAIESELGKQLVPLQEGLPWKNSLQLYRALLTYQEKICALREKVKSRFLTPVIKEASIKALRNKLLGAGVLPNLITKYLSDEKKLNERLFFHSKLVSNDSLLTEKSVAIQKQISDLEANFRKKILSEYETAANGGAGDCFFYSCEQLSSADNMEGWRKRIGEELKNNKEQYSDYVKERLKDDDRVDSAIRDSKSYESYCKWIQGTGHWGGEPEVRAFSAIIKQPVLILQRIGQEMTWRGAINLHFNEDPLIFFNDNAFHYEAMIKK